MDWKPSVRPSARPTPTISCVPVLPHAPLQQIPQGMLPVGHACMPTVGDGLSIPWRDLSQFDQAAAWCQDGNGLYWMLQGAPPGNNICSPTSAGFGMGNNICSPTSAGFGMWPDTNFEAAWGGGDTSTTNNIGTRPSHEVGMAPGNFAPIGNLPPPNCPRVVAPPTHLNNEHTAAQAQPKVEIGQISATLQNLQSIFPHAKIHLPTSPESDGRPAIVNSQQKTDVAAEMAQVLATGNRHNVQSIEEQTAKADAAAAAAREIKAAIGAGSDNTLHEPENEPDEDPLAVVLGRWIDSKNSEYDVVLDENEQRRAKGSRSCTVTTTRPNGKVRVTRCLIRLNKVGQITWSSSYYLDEDSATEQSIRWASWRGTKPFVWERVSNDSDRKAAGHGWDQSEKENYYHNFQQSTVTDKIARPQCTGMSPHFCVFFGDSRGIAGWTSADGSRRNRWDTVFETLLKCVSVDGRWSREVEASVFVGADSIHITGAIQALANPVMHRSDGSTYTKSATPQYWQEMLWEQYGVNHPGLTWEIESAHKDKKRNLKQTRDAMLRRVDSIVEDAPPDSIVLVLDGKDATVGYDELKTIGQHREPWAETVFLLLEMDFQDEASNELFEAIVAQFSTRLGYERVIRTKLFKDASETKKFTAAKAASFLNAEYRHGSLGHAVAGAESWVDEWDEEDDYETSTRRSKAKQWTPPRSKEWTPLNPTGSSRSGTAGRKAEIRRAAKAERAAEHESSF